MSNFPTSLDDATTLPDPSAIDKQNSPSHSLLHSKENESIKALEAKVGIGATAPAVNKVLLGTGVGTSAWQGLTSAELRGVLSDETGTGSAVFSTTPTITTPKVDTINEETAGHGVTADGLNIKDGKLNTANSVVTSNITDASVLPAKWSNTYKFSVYYDGTAALTASMKMPFNKKDFDTGSNFDNVTNFRFTAPINGFYYFTTTQSYNGSVTRAWASFYKNGSEYVRGIDATYTAQYGTVCVALIQLVAGDYIEVYEVLISGSGTFNNSPVHGNSFSGFLVTAT